MKHEKQPCQKRKKKYRPKYDYSKVHITQHAIDRYVEATGSQNLSNEEVSKILLDRLIKSNKRKYNHRTQQITCWDDKFIYYVRGGFLTTVLAPERADIWKLPFDIHVG